MQQVANRGRTGLAYGLNNRSEEWSRPPKPSRRMRDKGAAAPGAATVCEFQPSQKCSNCKQAQPRIGNNTRR
jgi:hypothetical protein